jgi:signal transduction histidine kinase
LSRQAAIIAVMGGDRRLHDMCRDIAAENGGQQVVVVDENEDPPDAALCIWDYRPGIEQAWRARLQDDRRDVLLIDPKLLAVTDFEELGGAAVVLKPVTKASLGAWLSPEKADGRVARLRRDRDALLQWLMEANLRLQEYDQARTDFLAKTVHDFRAPLMSTSGYAGLLLEGSLGPLTSEQRDVLERVRTSLKRLSRMTAAMFELSIGGRADATLEVQRADVRKAIEQALHETGPMAWERSLEVRVNLAEPGRSMSFEPGQMEQVALNLFENACKFTPRAGRIEVAGYPYFWERRCGGAGKPPEIERRRRTDCAANVYRVDISNSGPSIPADRLAEIFEEYASYGAGERSRGSGLGLAICKSIIQQHRGRIWAENRESGPVLSFVLPFEAEVEGKPSAGEGVQVCQRGAV